MFFDHYPYTNFHNVNLDWVLQAVKAWGQTVEANDRAFQDLKEANEDFKAYVTNYLQDLDITDEINTKLDNMLASGILTPYFAPYVKGYVDSWLASHVTPTSPALDSTLTLSGAAARADSTGKRLKDLAYIDALSTPEIIAALNRSQVLPGYRVQGIAYDYNGHYYVCGGSVDETGTGVIVKMTKPDFTDAEITEIPQLGHANDITYYDGYLYVCTVGGGDAPQWGIYKINVNDFTDKTLISNAPENTIGISYRQGDFWILAPYRIYRTTDFTSYEVVVANTNDLLTAYGIPTSGRISQTIFRVAGYLIGWVCSFVFEDRHYGALTFFNSAGEAIAFKMFPAYHTEIQGAVYTDMSIYLLADGNMVNVFRMDPRHLSYVQLKSGDDLNSFTGRGTLYSTGSNVSAELLNSPSSGEGFTVQVDRLGVYNTIQTARTNSGRELYRIKSFNTDTWGEWIEPAAEVAQIKEDLSEVVNSIVSYNSIDILPLFSTYTNRTVSGITFTFSADKKSCVANGTASGPARTYLFNNSQALPAELKPGKSYCANVDTTSTYLYLYFTWYKSEGVLNFSEAIGHNKFFTVPEDVTGLVLSVAVSNGRTVNNARITFEILNADSNKTLQNGLENVAENVRSGRVLTIARDDIINGTYNSLGEVVANSARIRTNDFIKTVEGEELFFSPGTKTREMIIGYFDTEKHFLNDSQWIATESRITLTDGYMIIAFQTSENNETIAQADYDATTYIIANWKIEIDNLIDDTGDHIPSYYFDNNYLPGKADEINQIGLGLSRNSGRWAFITDYHSDANAGHSPALIAYLIKKCGIRNTVFNGDAITRYDSKIAAYNELCRFIDLFSPISGIASTYYVTGNHEYNNSDLQHTEYELSKSAIFMLFNDPLKNAVCMANTNTFYVDDSNAKIRYYFIDCERGGLISLATVRAILKSLENAPDDYGTVIFSHTGLTTDNSAIIERFGYILAGFKAWNDGENYVYDGVTYNYTTTATTRVFVGAITGHTHLEGYIIYDNRFPVIAVPCDCYKAPQQVSHPERVSGTILEQSFEILQIDIDAKRIYLTRIGWGNNRTFSFGEGAGLVT